jgi:hypothetical protein
MTFSVSAFSDTYPTKQEYYSSAFPVEFYSDGNAACTGAAHHYGASYTGDWDGTLGVIGNCKIYNAGSLVTSNKIGINYTCPYGGSYSSADNYATCQNAPACDAGEVRDTVTGECKPAPLNCGANQYDNAGVCTPIPDCNANEPLGNHFFDVTTKACATTGHVGTLCISDVYSKYCPPIDDCKEPGYICTNKPDVVGEAAATRQAEIDAAKAAADAKKAEIAAVAAAAAQASQAKEAAAAKAKTDKDAAAAAVASATASGVQSAIDAAIQSYSKFANDYIDSLAKATNSTAAKQKAADIDGQAGTEVDAIPGSNPGNADGHKDNVNGLYPGAVRALDDAVTGNGNGNGAGSGVGTKDSPSIDTSKLNKEETQKSIDTSLKGIKDALGAPSTGESDTTMPDVDKGVKDAMQGVIDDVNGVDTSLGTNPAAAVGMTSSYWSYAQGTCFAHEFDLGKFGSVKLDKFCNIYDEHIRPLLVLVLGFFGVLHVWSYWASIIAMSI